MAKSQRQAQEPVEEVSGKLTQISKSFGTGWRFGTVHDVGKIVGDIPSNAQVGDFCVITGRWVENNKYGRQFKVETLRIETPRDVLGVQNYLDRYYPWIGPIVAEALVRHFGPGLFNAVEHNPMALTAVRGITEARAQQIHETFLQIKEDGKYDIFFSTHGISHNLVQRLLDAYETKADAVRVIKENPYELADDVWGVGFSRADQIAGSIGVPKDSGKRIRAGIRWVLQDAANTGGHTCLPKNELITRACTALDAPVALVKAEILAGIGSGGIIEEGDFLYDANLHKAEVSVARSLRRLALQPISLKMHPIPQEDLDLVDEDQAYGLEMSLKSRINIITGGPGVGKTWLVNLIRKALGDDRKLALAAPTGKAAKRMYDATGKEALTIHRLLEYSHRLGGFQRGPGNPLTCETLIVDETSMMDIKLMASLMAAVGDKTQVIFVGDVDQLPSVGPGNVLAGMIQSGSIPVARLQRLHRQAKDSMINVNAKRINSGQGILVDNKAEKTDFWFVPQEDKDKIQETIIQVCRKIPERFGFSNDGIQVLCPQKKGKAGAIEINEALRPILNPDGEPIRGLFFQKGDRVIQLKNNYELEIFNGDIGKVCGSKWDSLVVEFEDVHAPRIVDIPFKDLDELQLAYALTVHKSQGSEFPCVIMPVHTTNHIMLRRNLLYTAITRARKMLILVGTMKAVNTAIRTLDSSTRWSNLEKFIKEGI